MIEILKKRNFTISCIALFYELLCSDDEIECVQNGDPFFSRYKARIHKTKQHCFAISDVDFLDKPEGTQNIRLSDSGCIDAGDDSEL